MRRYELDINGKSFTLTVRKFTSGEAELEVDGTRYTVRVDDVVTEGPQPSPVRPTKSLAQAGRAEGGSAGVAPSGAAAPSRAPAGGTGAAGAVSAPIPGQVLKLLVAEGDEVSAGKPLLVMEAMKMENVINAPTDGTVGSILVNAGDAVAQGQELLVIV